MMKKSKTRHLLAARLAIVAGVGLMMPVAMQAQDNPSPPATPPTEAQAPAPNEPATDEVQDEALPEQPEQPEQDEDDVQAERAALQSELASAKRLKVELDALLGPDGQIDTTKGNEAKTSLSNLATRCGILANSAMHDEVRFVLLDYQARALAALVSLMPANNNIDQRIARLDRLRDVASLIGVLGLPGSASTADYWILLADLAQASTSNATPMKRQARAEAALTDYIEIHQQDPLADEYLLDTRLSLAELMDQRGAQRGVANLLEAIGPVPRASPRFAQVKRLRESIDRIGTPIRIELVSTQLELWQSADHIGKPVLIHVYADGVASSVQLIDRITRAIVDGSINGIALVSLRVGEPIASEPAPPWPTLPVQIEPGGVLDQLGVAALPTLAWLDSEGQLASIGTTAAVLDQLQALLPVDEVEPADEDETAQPPAPDEPADPSGADDEQP